MMVFIDSIGKKIWPGYLPPEKDELLSSWISRIAMSHFTTPQLFVENYMGYTGNITRIDIDMNPPPHIKKSILENTPLLKSEVALMTLNALEDRIINRRAPKDYLDCMLMSNGKIHKYTRRNMVFCATCMSSDRPYMRRSWRLATTIVCIECGTYMKDRCKSCSSTISFYRNGEHNRSLERPTIGLDGVLCGCGFDFSKEQDIEKIQLKDLHYQQFIDSTVTNGHNSYSQYSFLFIEGFLRLSESLANTSSTTKSRSSINRMIDTNIPFIHRPFKHWSLDQRRKVLPPVLAILKSDPEILYRFQKSDLLKISDRELPYWLSSALSRF